MKTKLVTKTINRYPAIEAEYKDNVMVRIVQTKTFDTEEDRDGWVEMANYELNFLYYKDVPAPASYTLAFPGGVYTEVNNVPIPVDYSASPTRPFKAVTVESESGWGSKTLNDYHFETAAKRDAWVMEYNKKNNPGMFDPRADVPDYYIIAQRA